MSVFGKYFLILLKYWFNWVVKESFLGLLFFVLVFVKFKNIGIFVSNLDFGFGIIVVRDIFGIFGFKIVISVKYSVMCKLKFKN